MSAIKECFTSRFPNGVIMETDFSQLEVVGLAALSGDPVLIQDLLDGKDMHTYFTAKRLGISEEAVTPEERRRTKRLTFALNYGSGANGLAKKNGISKQAAQDFIDAFYERYHRVEEWQREVFDAVAASRQVTGEFTPKGYPKGVGHYESVTGRTYTFFEKDKPDSWKGKDATPDFNPPEIKNYPVQGLATADIMALYRAEVFSEWARDEERELWLPINTVHDSVMFDVDSRTRAYVVAERLEKQAEALPEKVEKLWGLKCPVPFKVETKIGPSWSQTEKIKLHG